MEKGKRVEGEMELLPEGIIQHIQSLLSGKEAAQTTILSKCWYTAWLTRPTIHFDEANFQNGFWEFVSNTLQRYQNSNLKIETLSLCILGTLYEQYSSYSRATELILKAMKMGVVDLHFKIYYPKREFVLPHEVLECENLIRLSLSGCKIDGKVSCLKLKSLRLDGVYLVDDILWKIISSCLLIEELSLSQCTQLFETTNHTSSVVSAPSNIYELRKLKCLFLSSVMVHDQFFDDFSSKFPCLEDLSLVHCWGFKRIEIASPTLEFIKFEHRLKQKKLMAAKFDVPRIRKFIFSAPSSLPLLSFDTTASSWESNITVWCNRSPSATWFLKLKKFLKKLSPSKVSLYLEIPCFTKIGYTARNTQSIPVVENLTLHVPPSDCPALFDSLFRYCRPMLISQSQWPHLILTQCLQPPSPHTTRSRNREFLVIVHQILMQHVSGNCFSTLEEFIVEFFDEAVSAWVPLPRNSLLDVQMGAANQKFRFRLTWG